MPQIFMLGHDGKLHDFVPLLDPNHLQLAYISLNQFPKNASFHFSGYNGVDDHDKPLEDIKSSARLMGTKIRCSRRNRVSTTRLSQSDFFCVKSKQYPTSQNKMIFKENTIQATCTIVQREHRASKRDRRKRTLITLVEDESANGTMTKLNRSTRIRPENKEKCCNFKFTIFCSTENNWYLTYTPR